MSGRVYIPEYIPPGVRNVDPDPMGKRRGDARPDRSYPAPPRPPPPHYNDASAPPRACRSCGGTAGGCAACWCSSCGAPPGYVRAGCPGCDGTTQTSGGRRRGLSSSSSTCARCGGPNATIGVHRQWKESAERICVPCATEITSAAAVRELAGGGPTARVLGEVLAKVGRTVYEGLRPRRAGRKRVKAAIASRESGGGPRRGGSSRKGG